MKKKLLALVSLILAVVALAACGREASKVSENISKEADNFNVRRRVTVINTRTDKVEFTVTGLISVDTSSKRKLVVIAEVAEGKYKKHLINMTEWNMYVVEDVTEGTKVNKYRYEVEYMPESIIPVTITNKE